MSESKEKNAPGLNKNNKGKYELSKGTRSYQASSEIRDSTALVYTPVDVIPEIVSRLRTSFRKDGKTLSLQFRLNQLRNIYFAINDNIDEICEALKKDFHRAPSETKNLEYAPLMSELVHTISNLQKWAKPEPVKDLPLNLLTSSVYIEKIPLGTVLIIAPFNYPLLLSVSSLVAAISAGNCAVLKVSELTPNFAAVITRVLTQSLDPDVFAMVNGAVPETTALLDQKFDKIMYTGSTAVGTIIAKKAAETLTPVLLELGGKSPAFVLEDVTDSDIPAIARRIVWGRFTNAGQTCVAIDYVLVHESVRAKLVKAIVKVVNDEFYRLLDKNTEGFTHIIHRRAFENLRKTICTTNGNIVTGGDTDEETCYISPTVIDNVDWDDSTMQQEIFGPVLPILTYTSVENAVQEVIQRHDTPLALYVFTSKSMKRSQNPQIDLIRSALRSGGHMVNDSVLHVGLPNAPFGGIGQSGHGAYHGYYSYRAFSHERTVVEQALASELTMKVRYPPLTENNDNVMQAALRPYNQKVWFGRTGDVQGGPNPFWGAWNTVGGVGSLLYRFVKSISR